MIPGVFFSNLWFQHIVTECLPDLADIILNELTLTTGILGHIVSVTYNVPPLSTSNKFPK